MSGLEGHDCWEDCDEGPHGCVCGNDCTPPLRFDPSAYDLPPEPARDALAAELDAIVRKAAEVGAALPPPLPGFAWRSSIEADHEVGAWGYRDESVSVRVVWRLEREA